jgi:hypothetical protein
VSKPLRKTAISRHSDPFSDRVEPTGSAFQAHGRIGARLSRWAPSQIRCVRARSLHPPMSSAKVANDRRFRHSIFSLAVVLAPLTTWRDADSVRLRSDKPGRDNPSDLRKWVKRFRQKRSVPAAANFKTGAPGDPRWAGSIPVRLRQLASADPPGPMPSHPPTPLRGSPDGFDSRPPPPQTCP